MRSHSIAGWGSRKSRRILRFPSQAHSGWNYCCRRSSAARTTDGLGAAAGDGCAVFFAAEVAAEVWVWVAADSQHQTAEGCLIHEGSYFLRSEERRVGKEGRSRWSPYH